MCITGRQGGRRLTLALVNNDVAECTESEGCPEFYHRSICRSNIFENVERLWRFEANSAAYRRRIWMLWRFQRQEHNNSSTS